MSEISSGLVAVAWVPDDAIAKLRSGEPKIVLTGVPMLKYEGVNTSGIVVLSDAEAKLSECVTSYEKEVAGLTAELDAKDADILEQCRINGMGAEREAALLGKVAQQSAALKLAKEAMDQIDWDVRLGGYADGFTETWERMDKALAAINEVLGE